jgi:protein-tyrosine phosphatase
LAQRLVIPTLVVLLFGTIIFGPAVLYYRWTHTDTHRLREVTPGQVYRSGQLTIEGLTEAQLRFHVKTVINLQNEYPDPDVARSFLDSSTVPESEVCRQLGMRYVYIEPDLVRRCQVPAQRPEAIEQFLKVMDAPDNYPVLVHCRAGLHRTGCLVAVYRMEYEGWSPRQAVEEMKDNGFGEWVCTSSNDYVMQYVLSYRPGLRKDETGTLKEDLRRHSSCEKGGAAE